MFHWFAHSFHFHSPSTFLNSRLDSCNHSLVGSPWCLSPSYPRMTESQLEYIVQFAFPKTDLWTQMQSFLVNDSFLWIQNHPCLIPQKSPSLSWNEIQSAWCSWRVNSHICAFFLYNSTFSTFCQYVFIFLQNSSPAWLGIYQKAF